MRIASLSSTCAVYRQVVLTAQILLKAAAAAWFIRHAVRLLLKFASSRLRKKKRHPLQCRQLYPFLKVKIYTYVSNAQWKSESNFVAIESLR